MNYQFHPDAESEHLENVAYYEERLPGLGASYLAEFESALEQVCEVPGRYPIEQRPDIRRIRFRIWVKLVIHLNSALSLVVRVHNNQE